MGRTYIQPGECLDLVAPTGGVESGKGYLIGTLFVVAQQTVAAGATFVGCVMGVFALPKTGSQAWAEGQKVYWDRANARCDSDPNVGPLIGCSTTVIGSGSGETTGNVCLLGCVPTGETVTMRKRVAIADVNAGATLVPAIPGRRYRLVDALAIAIGGNVGAVTTVDILGTVTTARKLVALAQASLTRSAVLRAGGTGADVLADGASFTQNDANTAITVGITGSAATTATHIDFLVTYAIDPA